MFFDSYKVEYVTYLWGQDKTVYAGNDHADQLVVRKDITKIDISEYKGFIFVGGYDLLTVVVLATRS